MIQRLSQSDSRKPKSEVCLLNFQLLVIRSSLIGTKAVINVYLFKHFKYLEYKYICVPHTCLLLTKAEKWG